MIYIDENGAVLESVDLSHGRLVDAEGIHHPAVEQQGHFVYSELPGGGRLQRFVVDVPYRPAYDEVTVQRYIPYTDEEMAQLAKLDYGTRLDAVEAQTTEQGEALEALIGGVADA